jgi:PHD/YefM family antitoxin component YafN of YafNO toxin-antitoxin module
LDPTAILQRTKRLAVYLSNSLYNSLPSRYLVRRPKCGL